MDVPIRILQVTIGDGTYGGVAAFLYTFYEHMNHEMIHFDFLYCGENSLQSKESSVVLENSKITTLHILKKNDNGISNYLELYHKLREFFLKNSFDIVHINTSNLFVNYCVEHAVGGKSICISHSHNTKSTIEYSGKFKSLIKEFARKPCRRYVLKHSKCLFACSEAAGQYLFGRGIKSNPKFQIIRNAIQLNKFTFDAKKRAEVRNTDNFVFGFVGRLSDQKNPLFAIDIFNEIHKINKKTEMWMVGEGELREQLTDKVKAKGLTNCVKIMGARTDVPVLMQAMDALLLPSLYEGLAIVTVEAQAAGLYVFASDSISPEHQITDLLQFLPLSRSANEWAKAIIRTIETENCRRDTSRELEIAGYDIITAANKLESIYMEIGGN